jgi:glycosyltransferase involved in cell wall biosynthesis
VHRLVNHLTNEDIERLANKHNIVPQFDEPSVKRITCGSDDHSSLHLAEAYTEVEGAQTIDEFWSGLENGEAKITEVSTTAAKYARMIYGISYQFYAEKAGLERYADKDLLVRFLDRTLNTGAASENGQMSRFHLFWSRRRHARRANGVNQSLVALARIEAEKLLDSEPKLKAIVNGGEDDLDETWMEFVNAVSNRLLGSCGGQMIDRMLKFHLFDIFHTIGSAGALYTMLAPYFVSFSLLAGQRRWSAQVFDHFSQGRWPKLGGSNQPRVAHFTDTFREVNGVARTLQQQLATARNIGRDYTMITCGPTNGKSLEGEIRFESIGEYTVPEYPELALQMPPLLEMVKHCYEARYTHIHLATPGPIGLAGLAIARILQLPVAGTYHTALPQYANILTDDIAVEEIMWRGMVWFYDQLDAVYVPSQATGDDLVARGVRDEKIRVYPRGVNTQRFHPGKRNDELRASWGVNEETPALMYAGRISKEKNLTLLSQAYRDLIREGFNAVLIVVGDGPYRAEMERDLAGTPAVFTGYLEGHALPEAYASSDALVFPSTTDTFGNVVLEAQASGIPVIVSDQGGPQENLINGETGLIVPANDADELREAMALLVAASKRRNAMGIAARRYTEGRSFDRAFAKLFSMFISETNREPSVLERIPVTSAGFLAEEALPV